MSHFIGLVLMDNKNWSLEEMLERYNEQTEDYDYIEFADRTDEVVDAWEKLPKEERRKYLSIMDFAQEYFCYRVEKDADGHTRYGYNHNPNAKWDWWCEGGRWDGFIKTTADGDYGGANVNASPFTSVDWETMLTEDNLPFCFVDTDGVWHERAEMGWWCMTANEKGQNVWQNEVRDYIESIMRSEYEGEDVYVYAIDFHI